MSSKAKLRRESGERNSCETSCKSRLSAVKRVWIRSAIALNDRARLPISSLRSEATRADKSPLPKRSTAFAMRCSGETIPADRVQPRSAIAMATCQNQKRRFSEIAGLMRQSLKVPPSFSKNTFRRLSSYAGESNRSGFDPAARLPPKPGSFSMAWPVNCSFLSQVFRSVSSYGKGKNRLSRNETRFHIGGCFLWTVTTSAINSRFYSAAMRTTRDKRLRPVQNFNRPAICRVQSFWLPYPKE